MGSCQIRAAGAAVDRVRAHDGIDETVHCSTSGSADKVIEPSPRAQHHRSPAALKPALASHRAPQTEVEATNPPAAIVGSPRGLMTATSAASS
jgi:hypothetical protein